MPFFSNLAERIAGYTVQLTITSVGNKLTVLVYPKVSEKDEVQKHIVPLSISGTPTELDQGFFASLGAELDKTKEFNNQIKNYEKGLDKAVKAASGDDKKSDGKKSDKPADKSTEKTAGDKQPEMKFKQDTPAKTDPDVEKADKDTGEIPSITAAAPISAAAAPGPETESEETPATQEAEGDSDQGPVVEDTDPDEEW